MGTMWRFAVPGSRGSRLFGAVLLGALALARPVGAMAEETAAAADPAAAAAAEEEKPPSRWTNSTELSLVVTEGNSSVETFGLKNTLEYKAKRGRSRFRIDALKSDTSDDPYYLVEPGLTFQPGETITNYSTVAVRPGTDPDAARFFAEGRYEGDFAKKMTWNAGASWDTNEDAGIVSRTIVFGGLGRVWQDRDDLKFRTTYGASYTDRIEEVYDPEKDEQFFGARLGTYFMDHWGKVAVYDLDFTFNMSVTDPSDYNVDLSQGLTVGLANHLALKLSLQLIYSGEPALEEVDVVARAILVDPDGVPGSGDEYFETVESGGLEFEIGEDNLRKEALDSIFRTSLQITF